MAYATITDVFARYKPIGSMVGAGSLDVSSDDVASIFISDAESFMNAFLAARYETPVVAEPIVTMIASDFAIANMLFEKLGQLPDFMQGRYDRGLKYLEDLRDGKMLLNTASQTLLSSGDNEAWSSTGSYHTIFSPVLNELDQAVDRDHVNADRDARDGDGPLGTDWCPV